MISADGRSNFPSIKEVANPKINCIDVRKNKIVNVDSVFVSLRVYIFVSAKATAETAAADENKPAAEGEKKEGDDKKAADKKPADKKAAEPKK